MQQEAKPTGDGYKMRERFTAFKNLFELSTMLSESFDIVKNADVAEIEVPKIRGGKPEMVLCEQSEAQARQVEIAMERAKAIEEKRVDPRIDNMLAICTDMTKISLDPRILDPSAPDDQCLKVNRCVENILQIDEEYPNTTQAVFCDSSIPNGDKFSVYVELKKKLLQTGRYTDSEVQFVHDAKNDKERLAMFDKVNKGEIRVIIGSTGKLGTGVNMQRKLKAAHLLDAPYVPKDVEQRVGRLVRQGNLNKEVILLYYSTKGTFDSYRWQILEKKQRLISQLMSGKPVSRRCKDIDDAVLTYAEMKAATANNPLIAKKMTVENDIETLRLLQREHIAKQRDYREKINEKYPQQLQVIEERIGKLQEDVTVVNNNPLPTGGFEIILDGKKYDARADAGEKLVKYGQDYYQLSQEHNDGKPSQTVGTFRGLEVRYAAQGTTPIIQLVGKSGRTYENDFALTPVGICIRLENIAENLPKLLKNAEEAKIRTRENIEVCKKEYGKPFEQADRLTELLTELEEINSQLEAGSNLSTQEIQG